MKKLSIILLSFSYLFSNNWHVSTTGSDDNNGSEENPFATIQHGVNAASDGDTVLVSAGTYVENINYSDKNIVVLGEDKTTTIIDGNASGSVVIMGKGVLDGFTITNGSSGGVQIDNYSTFHPVISNAIISGNTTSGNGGGVEATGYSDVTIEHTLIYDNNSSWGGGVYADIDANVYIKNSTIAYNSASVGNGLMVYAYAYMYVENSIVQFNNSVNTWSSASISISYSNVEGIGGNGSIDTDPLFVDHTNGDFSLQPESPCIDAGDPDIDNDGEDYNTDIDDQDPDGTRIDMGAYYYDQRNFVWHVSIEGSDENDGSEEYPFATIQKGIDVSGHGDTVLVQEGTYLENINYNGKNIVIGSLTLTTQDTSFKHTTIIDGNHIDRVVTFNNEEDSTAVLCGFTIMNGFSEGTSSEFPAGRGAGIWCHFSSPTITNCIIKDNEASGLDQFTGRGGGIACLTASPKLVNVDIINNISFMGGGGLYCREFASPKLYNVRIIGNHSTGGAGGGVHLESGSDPIFENVLIANNHSSNAGGGIHINGAPTFNHVTFTGNSSNTSGGAIYVYPNSGSPTINFNNSIVWDNGIDPINNTSEIINLEFQFCDIEDIEESILGGGMVYWGTGIIDEDPLFCNSDSSDFTLFNNSPCVSTGQDGTNMGAYGVGCYIPSHEGPVWHVSTEGSDLNSGSEVYPFETLQKGIDASSDGDTVLVMSGTYPVNHLTVSNKAISIIAENNNVIIDGQNQNRILSVTNSMERTFIIDGFTIQNGDAQNQDGFVIQATGGTNFFNNLILKDNGQGRGHTLFRGNHPDSTFFNNCIVANNSAENAAGIGHSTVTNSLIYGNHGSNNSAPLNQCIVRNCTIINNGGGNPGGAVSLCYEVVNSIIRDNDGGTQVYNSPVTFSNVEGGYEGIGNIDSDPMFCSPDSNDYYLNNNSPCIGAGQEGTDIGAFGIGCYDDYFGPTWYVSVDGNDSANGSPENPYASIQHAINHSEDGDTVIIYSGTYQECFNYNAKSLMIGSMYLLDGDTSHISNTIISGENCEGAYSVAQIYPYPFDIFTGTFGLVGLAIQDHLRGIHAGGSGYSEELYNVSLKNLLIKNTYHGIYTNSGTQINIENSIIRNNHFGIYVNSTAAFDLFGDSLMIYENTGGGLYLDYSGGTVAPELNEKPRATIKNSIFHSNSGYYVGAIYNAGDIILENVTITNNTSLWWVEEHSLCGNIDCSGALYQQNEAYTGNGEDPNEFEPSITAINSIIYGNIPPNATSHNDVSCGACQSDPGVFTFNYSNIQEATEFYFGGDVQMNLNPQFVDPSQFEFSLQSTSPCIDAGDPDSELDPDNTISDLGAFYFHQGLTPSFTLQSSYYTNQNSVVVALSFNEEISGLSEDDFLLTNCTISNIEDNSDSYIINLEPNSEGMCVIALPENTLTGSNGIGNIGSQESFVYDISPPTFESNHNLNTPTNQSSYDVELVFSEAISGDFENSLILLNCEIDSISPIDDESFSIAINAQSGGLVRLDLIENSFLDLAGNGNISGTVFETYYDNTAPSVSIISPESGASLDIGDNVEIIWDSSDDYGLSYTNIYYRNGQDWNLIADDLANVNSFSWFIPNEPSNDSQLMVTVEDSVGLMDSSIVFNLNYLISYPSVQNIDPQSGLISSFTNEINLFFSQSIDSNSINDESVLIESLGSTDFHYDFSYIDSSSSIRISLFNLQSLDTIMINLDPTISNLYGYSLDGNIDGVGGDGLTIEYLTSILGDYNTNMMIDIEDIYQFISNWENEIYAYELGPFRGTIPYVHVVPDSNYNYQDMGVFAMMWNWSHSNNTMSFANYEDDGLPITLEAEHDSLYLNIPSDLSVYQVQIQYKPGSFFIGALDKEDRLFLTHQEQELGVYTIMAQPGQKQLVIPIQISGKDADISISYKGITGQGELAGQMTKSMTIANVPDEFVLYPNYPNPFNPSTKIDYGLPKEASVQLVIFDILGREVVTLVDGIQKSGYRSVLWNGADAYGINVSAGMYFYLLQAGDFRQINKMILLK